MANIYLVLSMFSLVFILLGLCGFQAVRYEMSERRKEKSKKKGK